MKQLSRFFLNGLVVIVPIAITSFVVINIFTIVENILGQYMPLKFPGLGILAVLLIILLTGWLSSYWLGKRLLEYGERLLETIPFVKFIYKSVKQVSTAVLESHHLFKQAVLIPYPQPGTKTLGFIVSNLSPVIADKLPAEHVCVFVPMSLNMTSGFNIIVPKKDIIVLDVTSESALQYCLTAGAIMPEYSTANK
ncbi:MAG: DUF502 domain-containing protein [Pelosinus sp.]|nr:DUF502 domain-containing protein [Pelosinus sp.]